MLWFKKVFVKTSKNANITKILPNGKKVLILSNLRDNFKKEIYDFSKDNLSKQFQNINFDFYSQTFLKSI